MMTIKDWILDILFPPLCFGCQKNDKNYLCENCWAKIEINTSFFCPVCQNRLPVQSLRAKRGNLITHPPCHPDSHYILAPATDYRSPIVQRLIQDLKYNFMTSALVPIEKIIDGYLRNWEIERLDNFIIIPIPLSKKRLRERSFNQAELIAQHIAKIINLPILKSAIARIKETPKQSEKKNWSERLENIKDCFAVTNPAEIYRKNILLIDDVFTSGATINEAVKILKNNGARKIIALTVARAR